MTQEEALREAQRRWGFDAEAYIGTKTDLCYVRGQQNDEQFGFGESWDAAFLDADHRIVVLATPDPKETQE